MVPAVPLQADQTSFHKFTSLQLDHVMKLPFISKFYLAMHQLQNRHLISSSIFLKFHSPCSNITEFLHFQITHTTHVQSPPPNLLFTFLSPTSPEKLRKWLKISPGVAHHSPTQSAILFYYSTNNKSNHKQRRCDFLIPQTCYSSCKVSLPNHYSASCSSSL